MRIGQLLAAGRSLVGQKDQVGRYRAVDPRSMPKFEREGSGKTLSSPEMNEKTMSNVPAQTNPEVESTRRTPAPAEAARPAEAPGRPKAASFPGPICRADLPKKRGRWARLLLVLWPRATLANPVALSGGRKPVQVELRLEQVKVVRNDLSDADLEVVAAKPPPAKALDLAPGTAPVPAKHRRGGLLSMLRMLG